MDTIWNCAFGLDIDVQNNPDNKYFTSCELVFSNSWKLNFQSYLGSIFKRLFLINNYILIYFNK
jgi:hypothetical protein